ncbi:MAG TPA: DUF763 domain-containing protein [Thermococcus paralvinellae]|uniref:DUF763 domain-containing protein n=1 Tax=Thermococcus paralvinellae TaxID=582419 RepID=A0A833E1F0_9EURY|nr:DUF763 domain-containing protein [Thermococcus paralvinellae]
MRGIAELPLHSGHVPPWLATRMKRLARLILILLIDEYGTKGVLERLADPIWFQALNNLIGMDWDSSGSTTVTTGILKEILSKEELGIKAAGGKGAKGRKTPAQLRQICEKYELDSNEYVRISRLVAKVDTVALQTGYRLYHHVFFIDGEGNWAVIQQGMNPKVRLARRYHWFDVENFTLKPHRGISGIKLEYALNTVDKDAKDYQKTLLDLVREDPRKLERELRTIMAAAKGYRLIVYRPYEGLNPSDTIRKYKSLGQIELNQRALKLARELSITGYDELLLLRGLGPSTLRALSLVLELVYDVHPSWEDPATHPPDPFKFAYAVGGKDGVPFPIDKPVYDELIFFLEKLVEKNPWEKTFIRNVTKITRNWNFSEEEKRAT